MAPTLSPALRSDSAFATQARKAEASPDRSASVSVQCPAGSMKAVAVAVGCRLLMTGHPPSSRGGGTSAVAKAMADKTAGKLDTDYPASPKAAQGKLITGRLAVRRGGRG